MFAWIWKLRLIHLHVVGTNMFLQFTNQFINYYRNSSCFAFLSTVWTINYTTGSPALESGYSRPEHGVKLLRARLVWEFLAELGVNLTIT